VFLQVVHRDSYVVLSAETTRAVASLSNATVRGSWQPQARSKVEAPRQLPSTVSEPRNLAFFNSKQRPAPSSMQHTTTTAADDRAADEVRQLAASFPACCCTLNGYCLMPSACLSSSHSLAAHVAAAAAAVAHGLLLLLLPRAAVWLQVCLFSQLPPALLMRIVQSVPQQERLTSCATVCESWAKAAAAATVNVDVRPLSRCFTPSR
jgi:hypothetical protein